MPTRRPLGPADLTPARLAGVHLVRAYDPTRPSFEACFQVGELSSPDDTVRAVDVAVDATRIEVLWEALRRAARPGVAAE